MLDMYYVRICRAGSLQKNASDSIVTDLQKTVRQRGFLDRKLIAVYKQVLQATFGSTVRSETNFVDIYSGHGLIMSKCLQISFTNCLTI